MAKRVQQKRGGHERSAIELIEEATGLIRRCSLFGWACYYLGAIPFVLALMFFWADMSRGWDADDRVVGAALGMAVLYVGLKVAQAFLCDGFLRSLSGDDGGKLGFSGWLRLIGGQALIHATALPFLGLGLLAAIPFGWIYSFYHNTTAFALSHAREGRGMWELVSQSWRQSRFQVWQNHALILILVVFALLVWINVAVAFAFIPILFKSFTGVETVLNRSPMEYIFSSTGLMSISVLTYAVVSPLGKALYTLRCFYGRSRETGVDLRARFGATAALVLLVGGMFTATTGYGGDIDAQQLDGAVEEVLEQREYRWRIPPSDDELKGVVDENETIGWLGTVVRDFGQWVGDMIEGGMSALRDAVEWVFERINPFGRDKKDATERESSGVGEGVVRLLEPAAYLVGIALLLAVVAFLIKALLQRRAAIVEEGGDGAVEPEDVDLESEEVMADALPEEEWMKMVREKVASGDLRLALRALFLATLSHLGEEKLVAIAKGKTNGEYVREMRMRGRGREEVRSAFSRNVRSFEQAWYGWHDVSQELLDEAIANHEQISSHAAG